MIHQDQIVLAELAALLARGIALSADEKLALDNLLNKYPEGREILHTMFSNEQIVLDFKPSHSDLDKEWRKFSRKANRYEESKRGFSRKTYLQVAAVLISISIASFIWWDTNQKPDYLLNMEQFGQKNDVLPGRNFAQLEIDGVGKFDLSTENPKDNRENDHSFQNSLKQKNSSSNPVYRFKIPKRSFYALTLSDGTKVWLNPESQLTYVFGFSAKERRVRLKGEAYFEVAKDLDRPFIVQIDGMQIKAVGTAFSVTNYSKDESKVILTEGKVDLATGQNLTAIDVGHQAQFSNQSLVIEKATNLGQAYAIKEGYFNFNDKDIEEILDEIKRWYGVDLILKRALSTKKYMGSINKEVTLGELCLLLKKLTNYDFVIESDKLIVQ
ncbi:FecR family protein [Sphingobacterium sp. BN32]|uniref:FecR family protein n=1 Tax=Sphingobacterium sp. BN32 TaxID=3058432 RepID=UPI00265CD693|nr:FecR family protein [Sphingobacterium sp. BN32]WKK58558.1 FecR domain-containing protein [Sphingobacterium sp. BN32]